MLTLWCSNAILISPGQTLGRVGLWGVLWRAPSAKRKDHHRVSSGWSSSWFHSNTGLSSTQYEQTPIICGVWPIWLIPIFLAATKQLYEWYFLSVCLSHLFDYVPIIVSSWNFQALSHRTRVTSMQKVKVGGQRSRSQRSQPNLTVYGL